MKKLILGIALIGLLRFRQLARGAEADAAFARSQAYELYEQKRFDEAAARFKDYVEQNPDDLRAALDYAALLSQLTRHEAAARVLEDVHGRSPEHEVAYFRLGVEYVNLKRHADAERVFIEVEKSPNRELADAAAEALGRLREDLERDLRFEAERGVFELAAHCLDQ
ncbi:MAG: tetratricopeptide repeat protein [Verrucomicrobia bacterium]|nr:MAG: tetratricopeptide repeat protein [Verrucomicrobiota bacterium]